MIWYIIWNVIWYTYNMIYSMVSNMIYNMVYNVIYNTIDSKPKWIPLIRYRSTWNPELKAPFPSQAQRSQQLSPLETKWLWMKELGVVALTYYIYIYCTLREGNYAMLIFQHTPSAKKGPCRAGATLRIDDSSWRRHTYVSSRYTPMDHNGCSTFVFVWK